MSFIRLPRDVFDLFTVVARPERTYVSSSVSGRSGVVNVFKRSSEIEKDTRIFNDTKFDDDSVESILNSAVITSKEVNSNIKNILEDYLDGINELKVDSRFQKTTEITRFTQSTVITKDTLRKNVIRKNLLPYYKIGYPEIGWGYTNYCSLHFPNNVGPTSASIIYPNPKINDHPVYTPKKDFTIEFYVKPSYTDKDYSPGTIMHMSSCFAISLVSGSSRDYKGDVDSFRLLLQLSHSADVEPNSIDLSTVGNGSLNLAYLSKDGFIKKNNWHHVSMMWSPTYDDSTGSFYVDGNYAGSFLLGKNILPFSSSYNDRSTIFIGNYYQGVNNSIYGPHGFFSKVAVEDEGVTDAFNSTIYEPLPPEYKMRNPFRGELHEIRIWDTRKDINSIITGSLYGIELSDDLLFYLPPFFRKETSQRKVLRTPFESYLTSTDDPINTFLSFGVAGHYVNLENHTREFVKGYYPRLLHLTSSELPTTFGAFKTANELLYSSGTTARRNITILPCDNGKFFPNFSLMLSGTSYSAGSAMEKFIDDEGNPRLSYVNMNKLVDDSVLYSTLGTEGDILTELCGPTPEDPRAKEGAGLTILNRTSDNSSNSFAAFDASNLFYGGRIYEGSYELIDPAYTGSNGTLRLKLKDNKRGSLYRADADSVHATWATVGFLLYGEGISVVTCPYYGDLFGKEDFQINLLGNNSVHVLEVQSIAPAGSLNTSRNPKWNENIRLTDYSNDAEPGFVSINRINFHDKNLNIVAKVEMAKPINKRLNDRIMFRTKFDF